MDAAALNRYEVEDEVVVYEMVQRSHRRSGSGEGVESPRTESGTSTEDEESPGEDVENIGALGDGTARPTRHNSKSVDALMGPKVREESRLSPGK